MTDLERRLRDTYAAVLDSIEADDRLADIPIPARRPASPSRRWRPVLAFGTAALATLLVIGGIAIFGPGGTAPETVATVRPVETLHVSTAGTLTEIRFPDTPIVAVGGVGGRPAAVALTEDGSPVLRVTASPGRWEEHPMEAWQPSETIVAYGSDGDALAVVLGDAAADDAFEIRLTTDGTAWTTYGFMPSTATQAFGDPSADRSTRVEDVSVDRNRVTVLVRTDPVVSAAALEAALATRVSAGDQAIDTVLSWGPDGIDVRFTDGVEARFGLSELGIDPAWVHSAWEVWITELDGSTRGVPVDGARFTPLRPTEWTPLTATSAGNQLYVGGFRDGGAVLETGDLSTGVVEPFAEVNLSDLIDEEMAPLLAVTSLRTADGVATAGVGAQGTGIAVALDGTALTAWDVEGSTSLGVAEMAIRGGAVATVGYPGVVVTQSEVAAAGVTMPSVPGDFGIADRHPTGITLTDAGIIALPQAGDDPSSFGGDGSAWLIDLSGSPSPDGG